MRQLTELDVLTDIAAALDVELDRKTTLGALRRNILEAIDRNNFDRECAKKRFNKAVRTGKRYRSRAFTARKQDLQHGLF